MKFVTMFDLAARTQFSVPQIIANRDGYIPVVAGFEGGGGQQPSLDVRVASWGGGLLRECLALGK